MLKLFYASILFFILEAILFIKYDPEIAKVFLEFNTKHVEFSGEQQRTLNIVHTVLQKEDRIVYLTGGSSGFLHFAGLPKIGHKQYQYCNCAVEQQTLMDIIRLVENLDESKDHTVVVGIFFYKFYRAFAKGELAANRYETGHRFKWFLKSQELQTFFQEQKIQKPGVIHKLFPPLNRYCHVTKVASLFQEVQRFEFPESKNIYTGKYRLIKSMLSQRSLKINFLLLEKLFALARSKNIKLCLLDLPIASDLQTELHKEIQKFDKLLGDLKKRYPEVLHWRLKKDVPNDPSLFRDGFHVNRKGWKQLNGYIEEGIKYAIDKP